MELSGFAAVLYYGMFAKHGEMSRATAQPVISPKGFSMDIANLQLTPVISLIAGVLILIMPRLLNYIVALYLIIIGVLGIFPQLAG